MAQLNLECKYCLGQLKVIGENHYLCEHCGNEVIEQDNTPDELQNLLISAYQDLRLTKFDDAQDRFIDIIERYKDSYMAYWGLCLAEHGVVFVEDRIEEKMVPTCYNMEIKSFLDNPNYRKALELAPAEQVKNYEYQASKIELIRKEWIEKANAIPPYDIFISFKHRDEDGNVTSDYEYLNDLWHELTYKHNLNVFFSPQTLKDKVSEKFEPYIYRALHTSKIMLLYGEKPEYFETTWVKNEWTRYLRKIKNKEKHPKSLIVAYKNFNANLLPSKLKDAQALDANKPQFINILFEHINNILDLSKSVEVLERIEVKTGQFTPKHRTIGNETVKKRELGSNYVNSTNANVKQILSTIRLLMERKQFDLARIQLNKVIELEPNNGEVKYINFLIENLIQNDDDLYAKIKSKNNNKILYDLEEVINVCDKKTSMQLLLIVKRALEDIVTEKNSQIEICESESENIAITLYNLLFKYDFVGRKEFNIKVIENSCTTKVYLKLFKCGIEMLEDNQINDYIKYHLRLVDSISQVKKIDSLYIAKYGVNSKSQIDDLKIYFLKKILYIDEGNPEALIRLYELNRDFGCFETVLKYASDKKEQLKYIKKFLEITLKKDSTHYMDILKYIPVEEEVLFLQALKQGYFDLRDLFWSKAFVSPLSKNEIEFLESAGVIESTYKEKIPQLKWYVKQLIKLEGEKPEYLYDLFKYDLGYVRDEDLIKYSVPLSSIKEFNDLLPKLDEIHQKRILDILNKQKDYLEKVAQKNKEELERLERERKEKEYQDELEKSKKEVEKDLDKVVWENSDFSQALRERLRSFIIDKKNELKKIDNYSKLIHFKTQVVKDIDELVSTLKEIEKTKKKQFYSILLSLLTIVTIIAISVLNIIIFKMQGSITNRFMLIIMPIYLLNILCVSITKVSDKPVFSVITAILLTIEIGSSLMIYLYLDILVFILITALCFIIYLIKFIVNTFKNDWHKDKAQNWIFYITAVISAIIILLIKIFNSNVLLLPLVIYTAGMSIIRIFRNVDFAESEIMEHITHIGSYVFSFVSLYFIINSVGLSLTSCELLNCFGCSELMELVNFFNLTENVSFIIGIISTVLGIVCLILSKETYNESDDSVLFVLRLMAISPGVIVAALGIISLIFSIF